MRATAVFEADERVVAAHPPDPAMTPTIWRNTRLSYQPRDFAFASRRGTTNVLAAADVTDDGIEVDDRNAALAAAREIAAAEQSGVVSASVVIPWLDHAFAIGDRISGLHGRDVSLRGLPAAAAVLGDSHWSVVGKTYVLSDGRLETALELARDVV